MTHGEFNSKVVEVTPKGQAPSICTDDEYRVIEKVYMYHPAIDDVYGKEQIAMLYTTFGMTVIYDMLKRAMLIETKLHEVNAARKEFMKLEEELSNLLNRKEV